jgi:hypothetical protein
MAKIMNKPKYQIGDRLPNSNISVCGVLTLSTGKQRYFLAIGNDNSLVVDEDDLSAIAQIVKPLNLPDETTITQ